MDRSTQKYYELLTVALSHKKGLGNVGLKNIFENKLPSQIFGSEKIQIEKDTVFISDLEKELTIIEEILDKHQVKVIPIWSGKYPYKLKEIYDPPACLYLKGDVSLLNEKKLFAVVGTRTVTDYGQRVIRDIIPSLTSRMPIVSGMATGVDTIAHEETLKNNGKTIAVLVGGPDKASPASNFKIYRAILDNGGLIVSENFPGSVINRGMFASRNRITVGMCDGVLVVEAGEKSGSIISAEIALQYGREVFAVPGQIFSTNSQGTNKLIKMGYAKLVQDSADILNELDFPLSSNSHVDKLNFTHDEYIVYNALIQSSKNIEELSLELQMLVSTVSYICVSLEIKGLIKKEVSGKYSIL